MTFVVEQFATRLTPGSVEANIGNTPLIRLRLASSSIPDQVAIFAKAEQFNPGGSIKDQDSIKMADEKGISMVMTGVRHFKH